MWKLDLVFGVGRMLIYKIYFDILAFEPDLEILCLYIDINESAFHWSSLSWVGFNFLHLIG